MEIFKFGGSTLTDASDIKHFGKIIHTYQNHTVIIVVSAMGKVTEMLEEIFQRKINHMPCDNEIQEVYSYHLNILYNLFETRNAPLLQALDVFKAHLAITKTALHHREDQEKLYSNIVAWGEILSSKIVAAYLSHIGVCCLWEDARKYIKTQFGFMNATVDQELTKDAITLGLGPLLRENNIVVMQGFIGSASLGGYTTTLGKEGSDYTGAILAAALQARALTVWKDVPGIMNADPKLFKEAQKLKSLSYEKMFAMAFYGAKVIHPKTISPLAAQNIPLYIKSFTQEDGVGTIVTSDMEDELLLPIYILRRDQVFITLQTKNRLIFDASLLNKVFVIFNKLSTELNFLTFQAADTTTLCFTNDGIKLNHLLDQLRLSFTVKHQRNASLLTILLYGDASYSLDILKHATVLSQKSAKNIYQTVFI